MRTNGLLKSSIIIGIFWYVVLTIIYYSDWYASLWSIWLQMVNSGVGIADSFKIVFLSDSTFVQIKSSLHYLFFAVIIGMISGALLYLVKEHGQKISLLLKQNNFMGVTIKLMGKPVGLGVVKSPFKLSTVSKSDFNIDIKDEIVNLLNNQDSDHYLNLFTEIATVLHNHPDAFIGDGHKDTTLYQHSIDAVNKLPTEIVDPIAPIIAIAHDIGKIISHEKREDGKWVRKGNHDEISALIVAQLPTYALLSPEDQTLIETALRYGHKKNLAPEMPEELKERFENIFTMAKEADREATQEEQKKALSDYSTEEIKSAIFDAFVEGLKDAIYNTPEMNKKNAASIFRVNKRLHILYKSFLNEVKNNLDPNLRALIAPPKKSDKFTKINSLSMLLFEALHEKKMLVSKIGDMTASPPLWEIRSEGDNRKFIVYTDVLIVKVPEEFLDYLGGETQYKISVIRPVSFSKKQAEIPPLPPKEIVKLAKYYAEMSGTPFRISSEYLQKLHDEDRDEFERIKKEIESSKPLERKINKRIFSAKERKEAEKMAKEQGISVDSALNKIWDRKQTQIAKEHGAAPEKTPKKPVPQKIKEGQKKQKTAQEKRKSNSSRVTQSSSKQEIVKFLSKQSSLINLAKEFAKEEGIPMKKSLDLVVEQEYQNIESEAKKLMALSGMKYQQSFKVVVTEKYGDKR